MQIHPAHPTRRTLARALLTALILLAQAALPAQDVPAPLDGTLLDVLPDEPTFVYVYGYHIGPETRARIESVGGLIDQYVHTEGTAETTGLIIGYTPPLEPSEPGQQPGLKALTLFDERGATTVPDLVLYVGYDDPYLKHCWPSEVAPEGGTLIRVYGSHLHPGLVPSFEGVPCTDPVFISATEITAVTPPLPAREGNDFYTGELLDGAGGPVIARRASMLAVHAGTQPPAITSIEPTEVDARGGTPIAIHGERFRPDTQVIIGHILVLEDPQWVSDELILGIATGVNPLDPTTPPAANDVVVHDARGETTLPSGLLYVDKIRSVSPTVIGTNGGQTLTFAGFGFEDGFRMQLGSGAMTALLEAQSFVSSASMQGSAPPLFPGSYHAYLLDDLDQIVGYLPDAVTVSGSVSPAIAGVEPAVVSTRGGDLLTVTTDSWHGDATPHLGGISLVNVDRSDPLVLRGELPPLPPGPHTLELIAADGTVLASLENAVTAEEPGDVTLTAVAPFEVAALGGTVVTLTGTGFHTGLTPRLGGLPMTQVELLDAEHLRGTSPPLEEGLHGASLVEGDVLRAAFPDAVAAIPAPLAAPPILGKPSQVRVSSAGGAAISVAAAHLTTEVVLRVGGVPVLPPTSSSPCALGGGAGGGAAETAHQVLEGRVPPLPPGHYALDVYQHGHGIVAVLEETLEVVPPDAPPVLTRVVSGDVLRDGSTRLYVFGDDFGPETRILVGQKPLADPSLASDRLIVGRAPALDDGEPAGPRDLLLDDPRGQSTLPSGVVYVDPAAAGVTFVRGDANASGRTDISDAVTILGYLFLGSPTSLSCEATGDVDGLGEINISDAIQLLQFLFLGGVPPAAPFPDCGPNSPGAALACAGFLPCGAGGGGAAAFGVLQPNVVVLNEVRTNAGDPIVTAISAVAGQVVIDDPPGGVDLAPGQIIAGYVPTTSDVIQEGVTFLLRLEDQVPPTCVEAPGPSSRYFTAKPAQLQEVFKEADIAGTIPFTPGEVTLDSQLIAYARKTACQRDEEAGGAGGLTINPLIDVDFEGVPLFDWVDGPNYVHAGFYKLRVLYGAGDSSFGIGISGGGLTRATFFSGIILDSEIEFYVDSHLEKTLHEEKRLASVRRDHIVFVAGIPIHFAMIGNLHAGIDANAQVNLYVDAGAQASFKAGLGFRFDGDLHNLSGIDPPSISPLPDTPYLDLNGSVSVKAYLKPEVRFFAGLLFKGLTADIGIRSEAYTRFHAAGSTQPVPCFQWGVDAGLIVTMNPEIQLFGYDLFDETFDVLRLEEENILGDEYGCKFAPLIDLTYRVVPLPQDRFEVHFDASGSRDPDGGPLRFRWDFDGDGLCDRATLGNPRTVLTTDSMCYFTPEGKFCTDSFVMRLQVTDDEDVSVQRPCRVRLLCPSPIGPRPCGQ